MKKKKVKGKVKVIMQTANDVCKEFLNEGEEFKIRYFIVDMLQEELNRELEKNDREVAKGNRVMTIIIEIKTRKKDVIKRSSTKRST